MADAALLAHRREALQLAAELQRRNVAARWQALAQRRSVHWIEAAWGATTGGHGLAALPWAAAARGGAGWLSARPAGGALAAALGLLRRPSWWSLGVLAARWLWRRRRRRAALLSHPPRARRLLLGRWLAGG
jgi:hypothetical protein